MEAQAPFNLAEMRDRLQREAEETRARLRGIEEALKAILILEQHMAAERQLNPTPTLPGIDAAPPAPAIPFSQTVREAVRSMPGIEFTVTDVEAALRKLGRPLPPRNLRTRITVELIPLVKKGVIRKTFSGGGNVPHRYRVNEDTGKGEGVSAPTLTPSVTKSLTREPMLAV